MTGAAQQEHVFTAIAAPARRAMLEQLARGETPVTELAKSFEMTLSAVSQHLTILRQAGLVRQRKAGRQRLYSLDPQPLQAMGDWLSFYQPFWNKKLSNLGEYLEETRTDEQSHP